MEAIVAIVGFLGAGKTTILKHLVSAYKAEHWLPFVILNDYENADLDVRRIEGLATQQIKALSGSCICCSGIAELRAFVNQIPERAKGITLIEANGTSDACELMGFLGVGLKKRFLPPVQISVVDVKNWQQRGEYNTLEANQIQVSSLIVLTHTAGVSSQRLTQVKQELALTNPIAKVIGMNELDISALPELSPSERAYKKLEHQQTHWASSSIDLPTLPSRRCIEYLCKHLPASILRIKGCARLGKDEHYTYFERCPDGKISIRLYHGEPATGSKLLTIGPGSSPILLNRILTESLEKYTI